MLNYWTICLDLIQTSDYWLVNFIDPIVDLLVTMFLSWVPMRVSRTMDTSKRYVRDLTGMWNRELRRPRLGMGHHPSKRGTERIVSPWHQVWRGDLLPILGGWMVRTEVAVVRWLGSRRHDEIWEPFAAEKIFYFFYCRNFMDFWVMVEEER